MIVARHPAAIPFPALVLLSLVAGVGCQDKDGSIDDTGEPACFPPVVGLDQAQAVFVGGSNTDHMGEYVEGGNDLNGDGVPDIVASSTQAQGNGQFTGKVSAALLPAEGTVQFSSGVANITGEAEFDYFGDGLQVYDFSGDGYAEIVVGARGQDGGVTDGGAAYLFYGPVEGELDATDADVEVINEQDDLTNSYLGTGVAAGGDYDGDGSYDFAVGMPGTDFVVLYRGPFEPGDMGFDELYLYFYAELELDNLGAKLATVDMDGDGTDDLFVSAPEYYTGGQRVGKVYAIFNPMGYEAYAGTDMEDMDGGLVGSSPEFRPGTDIEPVQDVNGDGYGDLFVGAQYGASSTGDAGGTNEGGAVLIHGPLKTTRDIDASDAILIGEAPDDEAGLQVDVPGDVDGDDYADFLIGAPGSDYAGAEAGAAYLVFGPISGTLTLDKADVRLDGVSAGQRAGYGVSRAGDVNVDGYADLLVSAVGDPTESATGATFLIQGCSR